MDANANGKAKGKQRKKLTPKEERRKEMGKWFPKI